MIFVWLNMNGRMNGYYSIIDLILVRMLIVYRKQATHKHMVVLGSLDSRAYRPTLLLGHL